ncbi:MAG: HMA2 domain-containing protein [Desulfatibacillaceae bacterium]
MGYYVHNVPGRLRVKSPAFKGNAAKGLAARALLEGIPGTREVSVNELTGSVVVNYDPEAVDIGNILGTLEEHGYFVACLAMNNDQVVHGAVSNAGKKIRRAAVGVGVSMAMESAGLGFLAALI